MQLDLNQAVSAYKDSKKRLLILGYNATLTTAVEAPRQPKKHFDQIQALTRVNPAAYACLSALTQDPSVEIVIFSGSEKERLEEVFMDLPVWLAAENGAVVRPPDSQEWTTVMETSGGEWKESVQLVLEYFCERTPRSFVEQRGTSLVWNYKYADVEFGRIQARDLLQHLLTGPISNAPVDIVRGAKSIEVRPVGVSKGSSMERILQVMAAQRDVEDTDFVLVAGHFLTRDENVFTLYEGSGGTGDGVEGGGPAALGILEELSGGDLGSLDRLARTLSSGGEVVKREATTKSTSTGAGDGQKKRIGPGQPDLPFPLPPKYLFTCTVGRSMASKAKYCLNGSMEVAMLLYQLAQESGMKPGDLPRSASGWFSSNELVDLPPADTPVWQDGC